MVQIQINRNGWVSAPVVTFAHSQRYTPEDKKVSLFWRGFVLTFFVRHYFLLFLDISSLSLSLSFILSTFKWLDYRYAFFPHFIVVNPIILHRYKCLYSVFDRRTNAFIYSTNQDSFEIFFLIYHSMMDSTL